MNKGDIIIDAALEEYKPIAAEKVKADVCSRCPDKRCERGERCNAYVDFVRAVAWNLKGGGVEQSKN